jgi:hypothetical protein
MVSKLAFEFNNLYRYAAASNVECIPEDVLIPGVTKEAVDAQLKRNYGADGEDSYLGREMSGWYLQQLLKLGAATHVPNLSPTFLVWDPDMIVLWPMRLLGAQSLVSGSNRVVRLYKLNAVDP